MFLKLANILELTEVQIKLKFFFQIKLFRIGHKHQTYLGCWLNDWRRLKNGAPATT
jgi:hypothetical protein